MRRTYIFLAVIPLLASGVKAQEAPETRSFQVAISELEGQIKQAKVMAIGGAVMGPAVKNAPYSAVEVTESTQTLADGNRIHQENQVPVYRDSDGRVRRENSADQIMIWDPVANTSYLLNPKTQTARKLPLGMGVGFSTAGAKAVSGRVVTFQADPSLLPPPSADMVFTRAVDVGGVGLQVRTESRLKPNSESLGKQMIEGVNAEGTRVTSTVEAGAIGNDRPIQITSETWYSPELQTMIKSLHSDPRTGEDSFHLTNISRVEPPSTLFQVPAEYQVQVIDPKMPPLPPLPAGRTSAAH